MSDSQVATPRCVIEIYPFEGGQYTLVGGDSNGVLGLTVTKSIRDSNPGTFTIELSPGGPSGPNAPLTWLDLLTPLSLCVIGMQRAGIRQIVMIGVVTSISEQQAFATLRGVRRGIVVQGMDFQYFFVMRSFYALTFLNSAPGTALTGLGVLAMLGEGILSGRPDQLGQGWFDKIMAGTSGILADTNFSYKDARPTFPELMATLFQLYPQSNGVYVGTMGDTFMSAEGSFFGKFLQFFPFPWYEFFVTTAPINYYGGTPATTPFTLTGYPPAGPIVVARVNPLPWTENQGLDTVSLNLKMNMALWDQLPQYTLDSGPISQELSFSDGNVRNFYIVNPLYAPFQAGISNSNIIPFAYTFGSFIDIASIHRYGYRPQISELHWFSDLKGISAQLNVAMGVDFLHFAAMVANCNLKQTSYFEPTPNMMQGSVSFPLRPDIMPGNKFLFSPLKDYAPWVFYIDAVVHRYEFGNNSVTSVSLSRGLPQSVYGDPNMMLQLHTGNAMRQNGQYVPSLPVGTIGSGLAAYNMKSAQALQGQLAGIFKTPGAK